MVTLHVDDLLCTGIEKYIAKLHHDLSAVFGKLTLDYDAFRHFGVDITSSKDEDNNKIIEASQLAYMQELKPITFPEGRFAKTSKMPATAITEYRSLVSGMAWCGVTAPTAVSSASLLQGALPEPTWADAERLNLNLSEMIKHYVPLRFQKIPKPWRLIEVSDSGFANAGKYSQGGFFILVTSIQENTLSGKFCALHWKSNKSKRVATSTLHSETLASCSGIDFAKIIQGMFLELSTQHLTPNDLIDPSQQPHLLPISLLTDCEDLHSTLLAPAQAQSSSIHLTLYLAMLKESRLTNKVDSFIWIDTRDMVSNALTKLNADGTANIEELGPMWKRFFWKLQHAYKWNQVWCHD